MAIVRTACFFAQFLFHQYHEAVVIIMARLEIDELEPGMVLASDLKAWNGRLLLGKGVKVTPDRLQTMKTWGIVEVEIEGISEDDVDAKRKTHVDSAIIEEADKITRQRFVHADLENEVIRRLFQICVRRTAQEITNGTHPPRVEGMCDQSEDLHQTPPEEGADFKIDPRELVRGNIKLPSLPAIFNRISEAINDPRSSATHVANIIAKDPGLSARLLKIVNSAFYGFPSTIDTISRAVAIIGTKELSTLALGMSVLKVFRDIPSDLIDMKAFWKHSIACGMIARIISSYHKNTISERFFLAGLLHDIGRLIMFKSCPVESKETLVRARRTQSLLCKTEEEVMGFNHAGIGGMLLKEWKLPLVLETSVARHHTPTAPQSRLEHAVIHVSDIAANALGIGSSGERFVPPLNTMAWEETGLPTAILNTAINQAEPHIAETVHVFFPNE